MGRRATINDVAAAAGVSVSTVSKAVHGRYGVAPDTMRRVLDVVERLGYQSSLGASSMRSHRTGVIGVLVPAFEPFSAEILKGVGAAVRGTGFDLLAYSGSQDGTGEGWERRSVSRLSGTLIDGVIMVTPSVVNVSGEVPIVAIDPHTGPADLPTVESDSFHGAQLATRYLIELGHTRIGFVSGRPDLRSVRAARCRLPQRPARGGDRLRSGAGGASAATRRTPRARSRTTCSRSWTDRPRSSPPTISRRSRCWASPLSWGSRCPTSSR